MAFWNGQVQAMSLATTPRNSAHVMRRTCDETHIAVARASCLLHPTARTPYTRNPEP